MCTDHRSVMDQTVVLNLSDDYSSYNYACVNQIYLKQFSNGSKLYLVYSTLLLVYRSTTFYNFGKTWFDTKKS